MEEAEIDATARLIYETGLLKLSKRTGWWLCGVKDPESIAEHSFRTAIIAGLLAGLEGADPARAIMLAVWHDSQETRIGKGEKGRVPSPHLRDSSPRSGVVGGSGTA